MCDTLRTCKTCKETKELSEFYRKRISPKKDYYCTDCKKCYNINQTKYRQEYPDVAKHRNEQANKWYEDHPQAKQKRAEASRKWIKEHPKQMNEYHRNQQRKLRDAMIAEYGGKCTCCGENRREFLTLDHKNGDGAEMRRKDGCHHNRKTIARMNREGWDHENFTLLCMNCNFSRGIYGYCPHEKEREII
jgi:hypothetical protein